MNRSPRPSRGGFTLVEMLVVLAIIGILAALLIPAIWQAVLAARENVIVQEISQMQMAVESYRQSHNDYPPNFSEITALTDFQNVQKLPVRHLRRAFPKHSEDLQAIFQDGSGNLLIPDPSEVLVSWLSLMSKDPRKPITSAADRDVIFPFDKSRLRDHDNDGLMSYFPRYLDASPYVYFDARNYGITGYANTNGENVFPYLSIRPALPVNASAPPYSAASNEWVNPTSFQIIAAGLDDEFGISSVDTSTTPPSNYKVFPIGANFSDADWDNIANFSDGKVFEDNIE